MSSSRLQQTSYPMKSITDHGDRSFRGEEEAANEPIKSVKECKTTVGSAYSQYVFDHNASKGFVVTKGLVTPQELSVYPGVDIVTRPLFCLFDQEDFESNPS